MDKALITPFEEVVKAFNYLISPEGSRLSPPQLRGEIERFMERPGRYRFIVGADSHPHQGETVYVCALVVHRVGNGGIFFYWKRRVPRKDSMEERIFNEAIYSMRMADFVRTRLFPQGLPENVEQMEVHLDVGSAGRTRGYVSSLVGMVSSLGLKAVVKPYAFAATKVADRYSK